MSSHRTLQAQACGGGCWQHYLLALWLYPMRWPARGTFSDLLAQSLSRCTAAVRTLRLHCSPAVRVVSLLVIPAVSGVLPCGGGLHVWRTTQPASRLCAQGWSARLTHHAARQPSVHTCSCKRLSGCRPVGPCHVMQSDTWLKTCWCWWRSGFRVQGSGVSKPP